ncbi:MAG TPA: GNAT family N-acetyltransferase [Nocardioides sp.]|nr:GNAT family N-acetyltransferase [Nocardioides sp.]
MGNGHDVWFTDDAEAFLARAGGVLDRDPVSATVLATAVQRMAAHGAPAGIPDWWFAVVSDRTGEPVGLAMRAAPFEPWPPYLLAMPDAAAVALAHAVLARGYDVRGAAGLRPAADVFAATVAGVEGGAVEVHVHQRLLELAAPADLVEPRAVVGHLRPVRADEAGLALEWIQQFFRDADEQAGRQTGHLLEASGFGLPDVQRKLADGVLWFWVDDADRPVHLTGANPPAFGVTRIGPVFTPAEERGRGWAAAAVAEVSRAVLTRGERAILFTDQANPTSNALYLALGYRPVVDTVQLAVRPGS